MPEYGYFLKRASDGGWDRVSGYVWSLRDKAIDRLGNPLYCGVGFDADDKGITIVGKPSWKDMAMIARITGSKPFDGVVPNGIYIEPEFIRIKVKNKTIVHENMPQDEIAA